MTTSAVTTAERPPAPTTPLLDAVTVAVLADGRPAGHATRRLPGGLTALDVTAPAGTPVEIRFGVPLRDAVGYWPPVRGWERSLPPDWTGRAHTSLIDGHALGCLYEASGATLLAFAAEQAVTETELVFGVSEQRRVFVVHLEYTATGSPCTVVLAPRSATPAAALRSLRTHLASSAARAPLPLPESGRVPVYSTWYAFGQDLTADAVEHEARLAADLGCGMLILDDGWQRGGSERGYAWAGDWTVDTAKFPDLRAHVAAVRELGMAYLAWVAPLLAGPDSPVWPDLAPYATRPSPTAPRAHVLDPREPAVRAHVVETCARLVGEYGLDGLKIDFLDNAGVYAGDGGGDIGRAMELLLGELRDRLGGLCPAGPLIELRQPYLGPGMAAYGNLLRANDCPADAVANRVRTVDIALGAVGGAVHSDMLMWDPAAAPEWVARQLLGVLHAVPQLSCRIAELLPEQRQTVEFWLAQWRRLRPVLLDGELEPGRPDEMYPVIRATAGEHQAVVVHQEQAAVGVDLTRHRQVDVVNATPAGRLVLVPSGGPASADVRVHDACGRLVRTESRVALGPGPTTVAVPPSGLLSLSVSR
ncbi:glycoside hydrolase family 36 protein [Streptomyces sp. NPDC051940]|uniref:glycoside hydrolase family 36 protein n=1 Tax=Streptomyces sp. NPDC051940 TaxID=3155675 RepID=UPI00342EDF30